MRQLLVLLIGLFLACVGLLFLFRTQQYQESLYRAYLNGIQQVRWRWIDSSELIQSRWTYYLLKVFGLIALAFAGLVIYAAFVKRNAN